MSVTRVERLLGITCWVLIAGAVWVVIDGVLMRDALPTPRIGEASAAPTLSEPQGSGPSLDQLAGFWQRDLRQVLIEPEPAPPPAPKPAPAPVRLPRLLATFVEDGKSWALFEDGKGAMRVRTISGRVDDFVITAVVPGAVTLRRGGDEYEVQVPKPTVRAGRRVHRRAPW